MCECVFRMKILLIFTLCLISDGGAVNEVTGYSGGGVLIKCKYETIYTQNSKYFCKNSKISCVFQIKTQSKDQWVNSGRFSLFDDTKSAEFWVMIRQLTVVDTGKYQCGVNISSVNDILTPVELKVVEDKSYNKSITETVHVGEDLNLSCKYPGSLRSYPKFLCRMKTLNSACSSEVSIKENRIFVNIGKFFLYDDRMKLGVNASIRNITEQDAGELWCGAEVNWKSDYGYKVYFTHISLTVTDPRVKGLTLTTIKPASSSSSLSSSSSSTPLPFTKQVNSATPAKVFSISTLVNVSSILLLFLIGISILIVVLRKRRRMQDARMQDARMRASKTMMQATRKINEDYENELNVFPLQAAQNTHLPNSVHEKMDSETNQSNSVYQSLNPNTKESDSVYQTLHPHTNQSDSVYQNVTPNTNQSYPVYQSLIPNTNQLDSVYQSLNPNNNLSGPGTY